jgi:hypothetical protein
MSSLPKNIECPPIVTTAASVDTRVRVDLLENIKATVLPANVPCREAGMYPALIACFACAACRTRVESSFDVRSAMERKCRGAKGDVDGVQAVAGFDIERDESND